MPMTMDLQTDELNALLIASSAVLARTSFKTAARSIFDVSCKLTGARSGYVALLSSTGEENEVLFLEAGGMPCTVDPLLPMPIRGLRAEAYRENKVVWDNDFANSKWWDFLPAGHVHLANVMFSPLVVDNKTRGIMGLANKEGDFTERDGHLASLLGEFCAVALVNSQQLDELNSTVAELKRTLSEVKKLKEILPICCSCKKIRDDEGYWQQVEKYISVHVDTKFTHGYCPECFEEYQKQIEGLFPK